MQYNAGKGRTIEHVFWHAKPRAISLRTDTTTHGGCETNTHGYYHAFIGWEAGSNNIAHYGVNFAGGNRSGHWEVMVMTSHKDGTVFEIALHQTHNGRTVWLSANGAGNMGIEGANRSDERFIISGWERQASLQRNDDFHNGTGKGFLNAHKVEMHTQGWIQAKGTASNHTRFNLGLFY